MATSLCLHRHLRPKPLPPQTHRLFSTIPPPQNDAAAAAESNPQNDTGSKTQNDKASSPFDYIKSRLKQPQQPKPFTPRHQNMQSQPPSKVASFDEIRKNLSEFRLRSGAPPPPPRQPPSGDRAPQISFQELYKRNAEANRGSGGVGGGSGGGGSDVSRNKGGISLDAIRESLQKMRETAPRGGESNQGREHSFSFSFSSYKNSLKLTPAGESGGRVIGGSGGSFEGLPSSVFKDGGEEDKEEESRMKTEFLRSYSYEELGGKLKELRPKEKQKEGGWFSLEELNERLVKLREMEDKESKIGGIAFKELRKSLVQLKKSDEDKSRRSGVQRLDIWNQISGSPDYMKHPPKEHLVEKYFHPDNMSASEKLQIELTKVRDEFKMSESDCGSARVQVAQLTTKIKYLSKTLHKKDKHSRKGLIAMVQQRKKLLKYLRRTDWESYCLLLDKLGLRDNPDIKMLAA